MPLLDTIHIFIIGQLAYCFTINVYLCIYDLLDPIFLTQVPLSNYISMRAPCLLFILCYTMMYQQRRGNSNSRSDRWIWISCLIQYSGIWLTNNNNNGVLFTYNWITLLYALFITSYGISAQWSLKKLQYDVTQFLQWQLILASILMIPILLVSGELKSVYQSVLFLDEVGFWIQIIIGALLSLSLHFLMISLIKYSSPLSYIVASICKTCLQALVAWVCFKNTLSFYNFICILVSLCGAIYYFKLTLKTASLTNTIYPV
ncbi:unnamed protein product [Cunninghamella echinulata]